MSDTIEDYISRAPKYSGNEIYRGISVSAEEAEQIYADAKAGKTITQGGTSSWSSSQSIADSFASHGGKNETGVVFISWNGTKRGTPMAHLSLDPAEREVLVSRYASWTPINAYKQNGKVIIYCKEND